MLIVRSPVRISFGGGGTDLPSYYETFGGGVLSAAINKHFYTVLEKRDDGKIQIISADLRTVETWQDIARMEIPGNALEIPLAVFKEFGCNVSVNLFLASEIPPGTGLGSSASVCVNLTKILATYSHISLSKYELAERAFHIARNVLGRPVGNLAGKLLTPQIDGQGAVIIRDPFAPKLLENGLQCRHPLGLAVSGDLY